MRYHKCGTGIRGILMRIAIVGQSDFGKAVLDAFLARRDTVAGVFCAPEKPGAPADPLRVAAEQQQIPVYQFGSLKTQEAHQALRALDADLGVMAYVLQFAPQDFVTIPRHGMIQYHPSGSEFHQLAHHPRRHTHRADHFQTHRRPR